MQNQVTRLFSCLLLDKMLHQQWLLWIKCLSDQLRGCVKEIKSATVDSDWSYIPSVLHIEGTTTTVWQQGKKNLFDLSGVAGR